MPEDARADPDFVPQGFNVVYGFFKPPASAYPIDFHKGLFGTKPPVNSAWSRFVYSGSTLGQLHDQACAPAIRICQVACSIQTTIKLIKDHVSLRRPHRNAHGLEDFLQRMYSTTLLATELMSFVAASYGLYRI